MATQATDQEVKYQQGIDAIILLAGGVSPAFLELFQQLLVRAKTWQDFERLDSLHDKVFPK